MGKWTVEFNPTHQLKADFGFDAEEELVKALSAEITKEMDNQIISDLMNGHNNEVNANELYDIIVSDLTNVITATASRRKGKTTIFNKIVEKILDNEAFEKILFVGMNHHPVKQFLEHFSSVGKYNVNMSTNQIYTDNTKITCAHKLHENLFLGRRWDLILFDDPIFPDHKDYQMMEAYVATSGAKVFAIGTFETGNFPLYVDFPINL